MTYDETLAVLHGWIGRQLSVGIATAGDAPVMIANIVGVLTAGTELEAAGEESAVFFVFADGASGFILAPQHFESAAWHQDDPTTLVVRQGAVTLWIDAASD